MLALPLFLFACILDSVSATGLRHDMEGDRRVEELYTVSSIMEWQIYTPQPYLFSTTETFYLQNIVSKFFEREIKQSPIFTDQHIYVVDLKVKDQYVDVSNVQSVLIVYVQITHGGKTIEDFPDMLSNTMNNDEDERLLEILMQNGFYRDSSISSTMTFISDRDSTLIGKTEDKFEIIIFISLLIICSFLAVTSVVMLCKSDCFSRKAGKRSSVPDLKLAATHSMSFDDMDSPTGVIGAKERCEKDMIITPERGIRQGCEETPMSQESNFTGVASVYSTTSSRAPLGIVSMATLKNMMMSPNKRNHTTIALYNVGLDDDSQEENSHK